MPSGSLEEDGFPCACICVSVVCVSVVFLYGVCVSVWSVCMVFCVCVLSVGVVSCVLVYGVCVSVWCVCVSV